MTLHTKPAAATHGSKRTLAAHLGLSATTVRRVWQRNGIKPQLSRTLKLSRDPRFEDKLVDAVPEPIGACAGAQLRREKPDPSFEPHATGAADEGRASGHHPHDYKRLGTTTLFAALNTLDGMVISTCQPRHRHGEWLKSLWLIDCRRLSTCVADHNAHPKPFVWTASAKDLLAKVTRAKAALAAVTQ